MDIKIPKNTKLLKEYLTEYANNPNGVRLGEIERKYKQNLSYNQDDLTEILNFCADNQVLMSHKNNKNWVVLSPQGENLLSML